MLQKLKKILFYCFNFAFCVAVVFVGVFFYYGKDLPSEFVLLQYAPLTTSKINSRDRELMEEYSVERRVIVPFEKIGKNIIWAFLIAEDKDFYGHGGIKIASLLRAVIENTAKKSWHKKPAGGSTITQQVAKNLLVGNKKNITRKIKEAIMAFRIEGSIPKNKILEIYLNHIYLGKGCYGISEAAEYYFGKTIFTLTPGEAAFLAALPSAPSTYLNSANASQILAKKRNSILYQMHEMKIISTKEFKKAIHKPIFIKNHKNKLLAPYFSDEIYKILVSKTSKSDFIQNGYIIQTTMDKNIQHCVTKSLEDGLIEFTKKQKWTGTILNIKKGNIDTVLSNINKTLPPTINKISPCVVCQVNKNHVTCHMQGQNEIMIRSENCPVLFKVGDVFLCRQNDESGEYEPYQQPEVTGGMVVMDPENGDILGLSGGYSFDINSFNCITQAKRQPGSVIKPFVYAAALENGMEENQTIQDKHVSITLANKVVYHPKNHDGKALGKIALRDGLIYSRNLATLNLAFSVGMNNISKLFSAMNLTQEKVPISAVLGAIETTPLNLVSAFSAFVNNGLMAMPRFVLNIKNSKHQNILESLSEKKLKKVISAKTAQKIKNMLHDTAIFGTAKSLHHLEKEYGTEIGGKTGTTNDCKDAWFVGYFTHNNKIFLVCIFVGYLSPRSLGKHAYGAKVALPIFENFVKNFIKKHQKY